MGGSGEKDQKSEVRNQKSEDWLRELVYLCNAERWLFSKFELLDIDPKRLKARCWGEAYDPSRHAWDMEIKAVTLHRLRVERMEAGWRAQVIFDI
ncbi:MAG: hypothetical protein B1H02_03960 [Candidatus Latescibacteria bacterium 4484_107]|nr:MAG: hypothetical protein B1H02_03960 [Candidatus Latescibacteria bacterium 4484_107]